MIQHTPSESVFSNGPADLKNRWRQLQVEQPRLRIRDAAHMLGVSEAELLVTQEGVTRLQPLWQQIFERFSGFGRVMALTRNEHCVLETMGSFGKPQFTGPTSGFVTGPIDLRFFFAVWHFAFSVEEETSSGVRRSIQFFDPSGEAIFKLYFKDQADAEKFTDLARDFADQDEHEGLVVEKKGPVDSAPAQREIDPQAFREEWSKLQDTHHFHQLLRRFGLKREEALRLAGEPFAIPLATSSAWRVLELSRASGQPIMVFVGNRGMIQIYTGPVKKTFTKDEWLNVLDPDFNLHLRSTGVTSAWLVRKPTADGTVTSIELFDADGALVAQFFGARKPGQPEREDWRELIGTIEREHRREG